MKYFFLLILLLPAAEAVAQYPWPVTPLHESHDITGTFCEYRDTGSSPHFHNGADVPKPDFSPVYAVTDAIVTGIGSDYIRADNFAYIHIEPAPTLALGDSVFATETVVGTILAGYGHVHLTDGQVGQERQPLREDGLTPFDDPWPPVIEDVRFYHQPTRRRLGSGELTGAVEITFRVKERNAPPGSAENRLNNGAYLVGYKILSRDRQEEVHIPGADGVQFRFDYKPANRYVHNVFDRLQSSTSRHVYIVTNELTRRSAWDTAALPEGEYTVMLFAADTRGNEATAFIDVATSHRDILPPPQPTLLSARVEGDQMRFEWTGGDADDLAGFHLYLGDGPTGPRSRWPDDSPLPGDSWSYLTPATAGYYYLTAVDSVGNESEQTDTYGVAPDPNGRRILIVDGFDRSTGSGSWLTPWHYFAGLHGRAIAAAGFGFDTAANEADIDYRDYEALFWVLGDESTADETFSFTEQARVKAFLEEGGRLFVSGSELAWDLDNRGSATDRAFIHDYLKVRYAGDDAGSYSVTGKDDTNFGGLQFQYGSTPYTEDFPDYFTPTVGGIAALEYGNGRVAGVQYAGPFGAGTAEGRVVVLGFPFETITSATAQNNVMSRVLEFFYPNLMDAEADAALPDRLLLSPNYPNPFQTETTVAFSLPQPQHVTLEAFDVLGRRVAQLADRPYPAGSHRLRWAPALAPGVYFLRLEAGGAVQTMPVLMIR